MTNPVVTQGHFRFRTDTGAVDTTPTWPCAEDINFYPQQETPFRIRFSVSVTTAAAAGPHIPRLSKNGGAYAAITSSSTGGAQSSTAASSSADAAAMATANFRLTAGVGTAQAGVYDNNGSTTLSINSGSFTELEYGFILKTANLGPGDILDWELYNSTTAYTTYTVIPRTCIPETPGADFAAFHILGSIGSITANQASIAFTTVKAGNATNLAVIIVACDNNQTTDGDEGAVTSVTDSVGGNTWTKAIEFCNGQGSAQAGATVSIWYSKLTNTIPIGTVITANLSNATSRDAVAITGKVWTCAAGKTLFVEGTGTLANDAADPGSLNVTTRNTECLRIRGTAMEYTGAVDITTAKTASWSPFQRGIASTGTSTTSMSAYGESIITVGTGSASDPTIAAADCASAYVAFRLEGAAQTLTATKYTDTVESFGTATKINRNVVSVRYVDTVESFGVPVVGRGTVTLTTTKLTDTPDTFGVPVVTADAPPSFRVPLVISSWKRRMPPILPLPNLITTIFTSILTQTLTATRFVSATNSFGVPVVSGGAVASPVQYTTLGLGGYSSPKVRPLVFTATRLSAFGIPAAILTPVAPTGLDLVKAVTETVNVGETRVTFRALARTLSEIIDLVEARLAAVGFVKMVSETINLTETRATFRALARALSETINIGETRSAIRALVTRVSETINLNETRVTFRALARTLSESINISEARSAIRALVTRVSETINLTETRLAAVGFIKVVSENINLVETRLGLVFATIIKAVNETINVGETRSVIRALARVVSETINLVETRVTRQTLVRLLSETISVSETRSAIRALVARVSETINLAETRLTSLSIDIIKIVNETVRIGETSAKSIAAALVEVFRAPSFLFSRSRRRRQLLPELPPNLLTSTFAVGGGPQTLTATRFVDPDSFGAPVITGGVVPFGYTTLGPGGYSSPKMVAVPPTGPTSQTLTATRFIDLPDSFGVPNVSGPRTLTATRFIDLPDSFGAPVITGGAIAPKPFAQTEWPVPRGHKPTLMVASSHAVYADAGDTGLSLVKIVNEVMRIGETSSAVCGLIRVISDTVRSTETRAGLVFATIVKVISETVRVNETRLSAVGFVKVVSETVRVNEALTAFRALVVRVSETISLSETSAVFRPLVCVLSEIVQIGETLTPFRPLVRVISETLNATETRLGLVFATIVRTVNETVRVTETSARAITPQITKVVNETVRIVEATLRARALVVQRSETVNLIEVTVRQRSLVQLFAEVESVVEGKTTTRIMVRVRPEQVTSTEQTYSERGFVRVVSETLRVKETLRFLTTIPSMVCAGIRLYAIFAGQAQIAPTVMGSVTLQPEIGTAGAHIGPVLEGELITEECD